MNRDEVLHELRDMLRRLASVMREDKCHRRMRHAIIRLVSELE